LRCFSARVILYFDVNGRTSQQSRITVNTSRIATVRNKEAAEITDYLRTHTQAPEGKERSSSSTLSTLIPVDLYFRRRRRRRNRLTIKTFQLSDDRMVTAKKNLVTIKQKNSDKAFEFTPTRYLLCSIMFHNTTPHAILMSLVYITVFSLIR